MPCCSGRAPSLQGEAGAKKRPLCSHEGRQQRPRSVPVRGSSSASSVLARRGSSRRSVSERGSSSARVPYPRTKQQRQRSIPARGTSKAPRGGAAAILVRGGRNNEVTALSSQRDAAAFALRPRKGKQQRQLRPRERRHQLALCPRKGEQQRPHYVPARGGSSGRDTSP